jgi:hypothetical protein
MHDSTPVAVLKSKEQIVDDGSDITIGQSLQAQVRGALVPTARFQHQVALLVLIAVEVQRPHNRGMREKREHSELVLQVRSPLRGEGLGLRDGLEHDWGVPSKVNTEKAVEPVTGRTPLVPLVERAQSSRPTTWMT